MQAEIDRKEFAAARPIPPFGALIKWFSHILQLDDETTYHLEKTDVATRKQIETAISTLRSHTAHNLALGEIVREDTKQLACAALATLLRAVPQLPLSPVQHATLAETIRNIWTQYDSFCEALSSFPEQLDAVRRCLFRHCALELALRAAAMAEVCADPTSEEDAPLWSKHTQFKKYLKKLWALCFTTQEKAAEELGYHRNEVSFWLNDLDIPPNAVIREWDNRLQQNPKHGVAFGTHHLWRLYVGRRIHNSLRAAIPKDLAPELSLAYGRIKRRTQAHLSARKPPEENKALMLRHLARFARIMDPGLALDLLGGATDPLWRRHIEALCQVEALRPLSLPALCEMYANAAFARKEVCKHLGMEPPDSFDEGLRYTIAKTEKGSGPYAEGLRMYEMGMRMEAEGDTDQLAELLAQQVSLDPESPYWNSLGRCRQKQGRFPEAEHCFHNAILIHPHFLDHRTDLAFLLTKMGNPLKAIEALEKCTAAQKQTAQWKFVCGRALLVANRHAEAKPMLLECAKEPYKFGAAFLWLAEACEHLGQTQEAKEYRKRASELGVSDSAQTQQATGQSPSAPQ